MKRFLSLDELEDAQIRHLLELARDLERRPVRDTLRGKVLGLIFLNPSLRTLASFQAGMHQLGGGSFVLTPGKGTWQLETRMGVPMLGPGAEHVREAVPVLEQYADALGVRSFAAGSRLEADFQEPVLQAFAACAQKPLINMESAVDHPCQALADWKTLDDLEVPEGGRFVLTWAWHPRALPLAVPAAAAGMALRRGMEVVVLRPEGYGLPEPLRARLLAGAARGGGSLQETADRAEALEGGCVVYAKSWASPEDYGDEEAETRRRAGLRDWCVDPSWFAGARAEAPFLHCLPVRRNVVATDALLDGPRSQVVRQAGNRLHAQKALLMELLG